MDSRIRISPSELGIQILQNCMVELLSLFPQLDTACAALSYFPDSKASGIGTDGGIIRFSPPELLRRYQDSPAAVRRGYLHMLLHCLCLHPFAERTGRLWELAADLTVEHIIERTASPRLALKADAVRMECFRMIGSKPYSTEELYEMLEQGAFPFPLEEVEAAFRFDDHELWVRDTKPRADGRRKWENLASGAGRGGSRAGRNAGNGTEVLQIPQQGAYDYRRFLRQFTVQREEVQLDPDSFDQIFYHFGLEHYGDMPLIEPLEYQEVNRLEELVIAIDTSGSCSVETVRQFLAETYGIVSQQEHFFREMKVYLIQCDCIIQSVTVIRSAEDWAENCKRITIQGRGGTDFTPVFRYVEELRRKRELKALKALLYFTDGDGVYPRERTDYRTAFVFLKQSDKMNQVPAWAVRLVLEGADGVKDNEHPRRKTGDQKRPPGLFP